MTMESTKAIWNTIDNLGKHPADVAIKNLVDMRDTIAQIKKEVDRLLVSCKTWEEKASAAEHGQRVYKYSSELNNRALHFAIEDLKAYYDMHSDDTCPMRFIDEESANSCKNEDCDDCLFWHYIKRAQWFIDAGKNKIVKDEMEGRKVMDAQDQRKATVESLDDIVRRAEGLGEILKEGMRR